MKIKIQIILLISGLFFGSCRDWLDLQPEGEATSDELFDTGDGYRSVLAGIYQAMTSKNLYGVELQFGIVDCISRQYTWDWQYADDGLNMYRNARSFDYYNVSLRPTIDAIWKDGFNVVANANNLLQNVEKSSPDLFTGGETERKLIMGEAYACRALMHFDIARLFAPALIHDDGEKRVPYVEETPNIQPNGIALKPFLEKVIRDLKTARALTVEFDTSALGMSMSATGNTRFYGSVESGMEGYNKENTIDGFYTGRGYRLSYYAITALLARVYQYAGMYEEAFQMADTVLQFKARGVNGASYDMFSTEQFWAIQNDDNEKKEDLKLTSNLIFALYNEEAYNDYGLGNFFLKETSGMTQGNWLALDERKQKIFINPNDASDESQIDIRSRYLLFQPNGLWGNKISAKWYCSDDTKIRQKNVQILPVIRATEMRYIMAECYARKGQFAQAYDILNTIRRNRSTFADVGGGVWATMNDLPVATDYATFQRDLVRDAQREWISEGQLFYLYKRLGAKIFMQEGEVRELNKSEYMFPIPDNQSM
ncbi:RagB/SusD family nutrient uptake outer membrane protein [uncultured Sanguibacteroides sp.]|uniref:RagB/SusD family nutrient uptake outer membrane protein n=1 Tax=uncultured Sanguibacteroides sp. TaxID=1635151 RepID=UPI0025F79FA9|nr:RagB/SusD family nutrient uptake outer membrane protein [uncultured Sanguibacteroides sp.]